VETLMSLWNNPPDGSVAEAAFRQVYADPVLLNGTPTTVAALVIMAETMHEALTEQSREVLDTVVAGDKVVVAFVVRGRHAGELPTRIGAVAPTGEEVEMTAIDILTLNQDGLITEVRAVSDELGLLSRMKGVEVRTTL